jgi:SAM-dependent methyltransferase
MDVYLEEYSSDQAIRRYTHEAAGHGISYLLQHDYANIYLAAIRDYLQATTANGLRLLEFGCGGGMNLISLVPLLERNGLKVDAAIGTDFSETLIDAANAESRKLLSPIQQEKVRFAVARNEELISDMEQGLSIPRVELRESFHVIVGVNTFRYCHRLDKQAECAQDVAELLVPGGICVMIDMNRKFPAFRSKFRDRKTKPEKERYLPTLDEYAQPFSDAGLEVLEKGNFCWVPHSAGPMLTNVCRLLSPILDVLAKPYAMRSLVISRKQTQAS